MKRTKQFVILLLTLLFFAGGGEMKAEPTKVSLPVTQGGVDKTFDYWYEFTQTGSNVTFNFYWEKATSITDLQLNQVYEDTNGEANITANCDTALFGWCFWGCYSASFGVYRDKRLSHSRQSGS